MEKTTRKKNYFRPSFCFSFHSKSSLKKKKQAGKKLFSSKLLFFISFKEQFSIFLLDLGSKADHKTGTMKRRTIIMMMIAHWSALVPRRLEDYQGPKPLRACPPTTLTSLTPANQIQYTRYSLKTKGSSPKSFHITLN